MNKFIKKLCKEQTIKLTEPSFEVCQSYQEKSRKSLLSAKTLLTIENFDDATALTYYSMYYMSLGLLYKTGIKSENHMGTILLLAELFQIDIENMKQAKKDGVDKQYYTDFEATKKDVDEGITLAQEFNAEIKVIIDTMQQSELQSKKEQFEKTYF